MKQTGVLCSTVILCICWIMGLAACQPPPPPIETPTPPAETRAGSYGADANVLLELRGDVRLRRPAWNDYYPVSQGAILHRGDMLQLAEDAVATVLCDDLALWAVPGGGPQGVNNGCPAPESPDIVRHGFTLAPVRGPSSAIPYVLSPRRTNILTGTPLLRWKAVADASDYTVGVDLGGREWVVQGNEFPYPGDPPLVPGEIYKLHVTTSDGRSSDEGADLGFRLLTESELAEVMARVSRVEALALADEAEALALAYVYMSRTYAGWHLTADAIAQMEWLLQQGGESPALAQFLGDLYWEVGLVNEARQAYETALQLAEGRGDVAGQAAALFELGKLLSNGNCQERPAVVDPLARAAAGYEQLGDTESAAEIRTWTLTNPLPSCANPITTP